MSEKLELKEFDILGIINLDDVNGIEKYVTPVIGENGEIQTYLSRSKEYYNVKSMTELAMDREELKLKLTRELTKKNFVILENMLNCSAKVYFKKFEEYIQGKKKNKTVEMQLKQAEGCLMEDVRNILVLLSNKGVINLDYRNILPVGLENCAKRAIEMDNKAMLYIFFQSLKMKKKPEEIEVLTPGYGSIYIGPFLKAMYGYNFTNTLKSKYIEETTNIKSASIVDLISSDRILQKGKTILLLDDNIGTGSTMQELKHDLGLIGIKDIISGAVQYNWRNYYKVSVGEKKDIERFNVTEFDILTPLNYAGHKLYKHAIDTLHSSGAEYIEYLQSKSYRGKDKSDVEGAVSRAIISANNAGLNLAGSESETSKRNEESLPILEKYSDSPKSITNPISKMIIKTVIENVEKISRQDTFQNGVKR